MIGNFASVAQQLAEIEANGTGFLRRRSQREAVRLGLAWALPALAVLLLLGFLAGWAVPLRTDAVAMAALLIAAMVFAGRYGLAARPRDAERGAGLALHDSHLQLKDRLRTSDEFLARGRVDGFSGAALLEAAPWIDRARAARIDMEDRAVFTGGSAACILAALLLLAATVVQQAYDRSIGDGPVARAAARIARAIPGFDAVARDRDDLQAAPDDALRRGGADSAGAQGPGGAAEPGGADRGRPSATGAMRAGDAAGSAGRSGDGGAALTAQSGAAAAGEGAAMPDGRADATSPAAAAGQGVAGKPSPGDPRLAVGAPSGASSSVGQNQAAGARSAQDDAAGRMNEPAPSSGRSPSSMQPSPGAGRPKPSRSQSGGQSQSEESKQGKGSGSQGQRSGQDSLKAARGALSLILAVPMRDRLEGMGAPGVSSSVTRRGQPRAGVPVVADAQDRGRGTGDVGRLGHRPATAQERALLRDYFRSGRE